jgi:phosphoribosylformylglycinamidine synthase PurS subunit
MKFIANINILPHDALLDPQGKAVEGALVKLSLSQITNVRVGKHIKLQVEAENYNQASEMVDSACKQLLSNIIMERYKFTLKELSENE